MKRFSAKLRREIIDWIVFDRSGETLYGDARDVPPTDWEDFFVEEWHGRSYEAKLRRARLERLSDAKFRTEALRYYETKQRMAALMPRKRGRPKGAGSLAQADQPYVAEALELMASGRSA
jgi:hypothetical protein